MQNPNKNISIKWSFLKRLHMNLEHQVNDHRACPNCGYYFVPEDFNSKQTKYISNQLKEYLGEQNEREISNAGR